MVRPGFPGDSKIPRPNHKIRALRLLGRFEDVRDIDSGLATFELSTPLMTECCWSWSSPLAIGATPINKRTKETHVSRGLLMSALGHRVMYQDLWEALILSGYFAPRSLSAEHIITFAHQPV